MCSLHKINQNAKILILLLSLFFNTIFLILLLSAYAVVLNALQLHHRFTLYWQGMLQEEKALLSLEASGLNTLQSSAFILLQEPCQKAKYRTMIYACCRDNKFVWGRYRLLKADPRCSNEEIGATHFIGYIGQQKIDPDKNQKRTRHLSSQAN